MNECRANPLSCPDRMRATWLHPDATRSWCLGADLERRQEESSAKAELCEPEVASLLHHVDHYDAHVVPAACFESKCNEIVDGLSRRRPRCEDRSDPGSRNTRGESIRAQQ